MRMVDFSNDAVLRIAPERETQGYEVFGDAMTANLRLIVSGTGKTFCYAARGSDGLRISGPIGGFPEMTVEQARVIAARLNEVAAIKPSHQPEPTASPSFLAVAEDFIAQLPLRRHAKSIASDERFIRNNLMDPCRNPFAEKPPSEVRDYDVAALVMSIADRPAPASAMATLTKFKAIFGWAMVPPRRQHYGIDTDPTAHLSRRYLGLRQSYRKRVFTRDEARAYLLAADLLGSASQRVLARSPMLSGLPAGMLAQMQWEELDLDRMIWHDPQGVRGGNRIVLGRHMAEALSELRDSQTRSPGKFVFGCGAKAPSASSLLELRRTLTRLMGIELAGRDLAGCENWHWLDLRRSVLTMMSYFETNETSLRTITGRRVDIRTMHTPLSRGHIGEVLDQHSDALLQLRSATGPYRTEY